jgi:beta-phosphoglucomutase-like phosphatase (HAD superfamily)
VLDMDGLMVDSEPLWFEVEGAFCAARGGAWTEEHARLCVGRGVPTTLEIMREAFGFPVDIARDTSAILDAFVAHVGALELKPGCLELLDAAEHVAPLAVASSSPLRLIQAVLRRFGITESPDIFLRTASELGMAPERCVVLEDSLAGATAGRAAGMHVIAVPEGPWEGRGFEAVADRVVTSLIEARACIRLDARP